MTEDEHNNEKSTRHTSNRLTYAIDSSGRVVNIDEVPAGNKCGCFCPSCKEPLMAKNQGRKRIHHFSHQSGTECANAYESMLHILAKDRIREAFLERSEFWIEFEYTSFCPNDKGCKFFRYSDCCEKKKQRFNLKDFYDSCEQEIRYDNINRRSDLKIFSSSNPARSPIYLEFYVTHASDRIKLHSGNKIVEIRIESENDIKRLIECGIVEDLGHNDNYDCFGRRPDEGGVCFYGFKNKDRKNYQLSNEIEFVRFILYKSGKTQCFHDGCDCRNLSKSKPGSLFEMCIHTSVSFGIYDQVKYIAYQKFGIPNCVLCTNYVDDYYGMTKICRLYKHLQIPKYEEMDTSKAKNCRFFAIDKMLMQSALEHGISENYTIFE